MNLDFGTEYEEFRKEVKEFCLKHQGIQVTGSLGQFLQYETVSDSEKADKLIMPVKEWQKILIEHGYFARHIPSDYGGYGDPLDIIKDVIINDEFAKAKIPLGTGGQGIDFLVPTLLEMGTEEQKQRYIKVST